MAETAAALTSRGQMSRHTISCARTLETVNLEIINIHITPDVANC